MSRSYTAEEAKSRDIAVMGAVLGKTYHALWQDVVLLHRKWAEYVELFGTKPSRVDLLNGAAPFFFRVVRDVLWEDTVIHIARLTDPAATFGKKKNLTVCALPSLVSDAEAKGRVSKLVDVALDAADFCRDWRNRRIAHRDWELAVGGSAKPLKPGSREKVRKALDAIAAVLNAISGHYLDSETMFVHRNGARGAMGLLYVLDDGLKAEVERRARMKQGKTCPDDYSPRDL